MGYHFNSAHAANSVCARLCVRVCVCVLWCLDLCPTQVSLADCLRANGVMAPIWQPPWCRLAQIYTHARTHTHGFEHMPTRTHTQWQLLVMTGPSARIFMSPTLRDAHACAPQHTHLKYTRRGHIFRTMCWIWMNKWMNDIIAQATTDMTQSCNHKTKSTS